jgi:hypothetical protein
MHFVIYKYACFDTSRWTRAEKKRRFARWTKKQKREAKPKRGGRTASLPTSPTSPISSLFLLSPPLLSLSSSHLEIQAKFSLLQVWIGNHSSTAVTTTTANLMYRSLQPLLGSDAYFLIASRSLQCHCLLTWSLWQPLLHQRPRWRWSPGSLYLHLHLSHHRIRSVLLSHPLSFSFSLSLGLSIDISTLGTQIRSDPDSFGLWLSENQVWICPLPPSGYLLIHQDMAQCLPSCDGLSG